MENKSKIQDLNLTQKLKNRSCVLVFLCSCVVICVLAFAVNPSFAQDQKVIQNKISLDIKGMDIVDVMKMLSTRSGLNIVMGKSVTGKVTLFLKNVDLWDAFEIILLANDLAYERKGDIINVMTQRDYELHYGERFQDKKQAKIIHLKFAKAADLARSLTQIKTNLGRIVADDASNTLALVDTPEKIKEMEEFVTTTDLALQTRVFSLNYAQAEKIQPKLQESITKNLGSMRIDERTNKIAITDYPEKLDEIAKIISAFDERTPQVLIDAQIVEITPFNEYSMGVNWDYWIKKNFNLASQMPALSLTDASTIPNLLAVGVAAASPIATPTAPGQFAGLLSMLQLIGETKILSSPRIMVLNNQEAKILVGTKDAYITSTTSQGGTGTAVTSQSVNFVDVGIKLYVTPTINRDGFVIMKIKPEISSATLTDLTSEGQITQVPIVTTSESETTVMVQDGATIIIAGLKKDQQNIQINKIPILGDIPFLGPLLFRSTKKETLKSELVIFITPRIVSGREPVEYSNLTQNKDIAFIQTIAKEEQKKHSQEPKSVEEYKKAVFDKIRLNSLADHKSRKGEVVVSFMLNSNGQLINEPRVTSSSNQDLNQTAINAIKNVSPFPAFPGEINEKEKSFNINLEYK